MVLKIISAWMCGISVLLFMVFYFKSKGQYDEYLEYVDKEEYGLKDFIPIGLAMSEITIFQKVIPMSLRSILPVTITRSIKRSWRSEVRRMQGFISISIKGIVWQWR